MKSFPPSLEGFFQAFLPGDVRLARSRFNICLKPAVFIGPSFLCQSVRQRAFPAHFHFDYSRRVLSAGVGLPRKALAKLRRNGYATGYKPREAHTPRDFNDLSSGIRRLAIDTRFQLGRRRRRCLEIHLVVVELLASGFCFRYTVS